MGIYNSGEKTLRPLNSIQKALDERETDFLAEFACLSRRGIRRRSEELIDSEYRQAFSHDVDRILHSLAYTRYIDKTQVFYLIRNDHITHRVLHVQLVSKIARTIGRFLGLNEDLIEAIALGHDIGHTPFGHDGEKILSGLCRKYGIGDFHHNVQSVRFLDRVERKGAGWNLCLQTLDGILCHDGEVHNRCLRPDPEKSFESLEREMQRKTHNADTELIPMTMEGCVVRMADTIAYIGRDLEDAIRLKMIRRTDIPKRIVDVLGGTNGTIVYTLVTDIIQSSFQKPYITFSAEVSEALNGLKSFNLERIYLNPLIKKHLAAIEALFSMLFEQYLTDIETGNRESVVFSGFFSEMSPEYLENTANEAMVRDFIAGMTDRYFLRQCPEHLRPQIVSMA